VASRLLSPPEKWEFVQAYRKLTSQPPSSAAGLTVSQWFTRHVSKERVCQVLFALIRVSTYSNDPDSLSMPAAMQQAQTGSAGGVLYVDGGWQTMVDSLATLARDSGVKIRTGETINGLTANTILAIPPREVEQLTGKAPPSRKPLRMACLDLALAEPPPGAAHFALSLDHPLYFSMHSQWARLGPDGAALVQVGRYLNAGEQASRAELEAFCDLAMPGWRSRVAHARFLPNLTVTHAMPELTPRASAAVPGLNSVYVAGDWVGSEGMLTDAATASALAAASLLMERRAAA
jgi:phytoene dehydrogenase-like protein